MDNLEKVEKLKEKANISYEEAREILEKCDWDLLEAVIELENMGKIKTDFTSEYSTKGSDSSDNPKNPQEVAESYQNYQQHKNENEKGFFSTLWDAVKFVAKKGCENKFVIKRHKETVFDIPVLLLVLLLIPFFWLIIILAAAGLFFGFSYSFSGPDLGKEKVNSVMDKATQMAEDLKAEAKSENSKDKKTEEEKNEKEDTYN